MAHFHRRTDKIIIVDFETTGWAPRVDPVYESQCIIEVGVCVVDFSRDEPLVPMNWLIHPDGTAPLSHHATQLTGITYDEITEKGVSFSDWIDEMNALQLSEYAWGSWGDFDDRIYTAQYKRWEGDGLHSSPIGPPPLSSCHINFRPLFSLAYGLDKEIGLGRAMKMAGFEITKIAHRGDQDALDLARLAIHLRGRMI
jgi:inhibitor of KinA sporulation pathway (predicted exonuclease)